MIKKMPIHAKHHLCNIFNKFWYQSYFPQQWKKAIIIPIHKPSKDHSDSKNYRPTALTSCLCKSFERKINERLMDYLERKKILSGIQCGGRQNRSTLDHLVRMEQEVRKAFAVNEHFVAIYFDLEKAYDTTWRAGILRYLYASGMRGYLPKYVERFLQQREFNVRIQQHLLTTHSQINGVPQGSVLSVTLFTLKIKDIAKCIVQDSRFVSSLYVDDFQIGYRHSNLTVTKEKLQ